MSVTVAHSDELALLLEAREAGRSGRARKLRVQAGLSQSEVASFCGVSTPTVSLWETGKRTPRGEPARRFGHFVRMVEQSLKSENPASRAQGSRDQLDDESRYQPRPTAP